MGKLEKVEEIGFDISDSDLLNAVNDIRELNNRYLRGEEVTSSDKARYYIAKATVLKGLCFRDVDNFRTTVKNQLWAYKLEALAQSYLEEVF